MKSVEMQKYTLEENSTTYCTPRSHPGETPTAGPRVRNLFMHASVVLPKSLKKGEDAEGGGCGGS